MLAPQHDHGAASDARSDAMIRAVPDAAGVIQLGTLRALSAVRHGFASRRGRLEDVVPGPVARLQQVHGAEALTLPAEPSDRTPFLEEEIDRRPRADALVTGVPGAAVGVAVADCLPLLIADPNAGVVAAVHAGWRGLAAGVIENAVDTMVAGFGAKPVDLVVGIGPAIGACCFEVGPEVLDAFNDRGYGDQARVPGPPADRLYCNLSAVAAAIIRQLGVPPEHVTDAALCTKCNSDWLWSYRQDGDNAGRMICGIALAP